MMTGGTPILRNPHVVILPYFLEISTLWEPNMTLEPPFIDVFFHLDLHLLRGFRIAMCVICQEVSRPAAPPRCVAAKRV